MSVNKVIIIGNLGSDPEIHQFSNGGMVANVSIATTERWNDRQTGERKEHTEWHRVVFNNRLAEIAQQYLRKGSQVYIEGSIRTRKWQDQNGQDRYSTEIRANNMQMLGSNPNAGMGGQMGGGYQQPQGFQNQGGYQNQQGNSFNQGGQVNNPMGNQMTNQGNGQMGGMNTNSFNTQSPQTPPQQQPASTPKPTEMAMPDAPVDDDIPF